MLLNCLTKRVFNYFDLKSNASYSAFTRTELLSMSGTYGMQEWQFCFFFGIHKHPYRFWIWPFSYPLSQNFLGQVVCFISRSLLGTSKMYFVAIQFISRSCDYRCTMSIAFYVLLSFFFTVRLYFIKRLNL